jgi:creatinine amidohydrolase
MSDPNGRSAEAGSPQQVRWAELLPDEFRARRSICPVAWLPLGLCEPHGFVAAYGLDTIKAEWLCEESARKFGGVVVPTQGWHIHETGYHARWLEDVIGEGDVELGSLPPDVVLRTFLFQLRAIANAGFRGAIVVSGHSGGNQVDLRSLAKAFVSDVPLVVEVHSDPELVEGRFRGDHAGRFEISQLMALRPDLVDLSRIKRGDNASSGKQLALGEDAAMATGEYGWTILRAQVGALGEILHSRLEPFMSKTPIPRLGLARAEGIWTRFANEHVSLKTTSPLPGQQPVSPDSKWKEGEFWSGQEINRS